MTGTYLLLLIVLTSAMSAVTALRAKSWSWLVVNGGFAIAGGIGYVVAPQRAGVWLIGPYVVFAIAPLLAMAQVNSLLVRRRARLARVVARIGYVLHPAEAFRRLVRITDAYLLSSAGHIDEAADILREAGHAQDLDLELLRFQNRWDEIVAYIEKATPDPLAHSSAVLYVRALGETGKIDRFVAAYREATARWEKRDDTSEELSSLRLFAAGFLGQPAIVDEIFAGPLHHFSPAIQQYWRAIANDAGGDRERAAALWAELKQDGEARTRNVAEFRSTHPVARVDAPSDAARELLAKLVADLRDNATYARKHATAPRAVLCYVIVAALVAIHAILVWRQQSNPMAVYDLGLFWSPAVLDDGEWWRIGSAMFLHAGWMHLAMNVFGLLWFGPFVERFLGRTRFAVVYLVGGAGGFAVLAALDALGWRGATAALGASGSVMALIGASVGIFLRDSARSPVAARRLRDMLGFVGVQAVFDILAPRVSMTAHVAGLVIGFCLGLLTKPK